MKTNITLFALLDLNVNPADDRDDIPEAIDDIIITLSSGSGVELSPVGSKGDDAPNLISVDQNHIDTVSFTVKASAIEFDYVPSNSLQISSNDKDPEEEGYLLHVKEVAGSKFVRIYNDLRQMVLQSKHKSIHASHLKKGLYFFKDLRFSRVQKLKKI